MKTAEHIQIAIILETDGFWLVVKGPKTYSYTAEYLAMGPSGHQMTSQLSGFSGDGDGFMFAPVPFEVLRVALIGLVLVESKIKRRVRLVPPPALPSGALARARKGAWPAAGRFGQREPAGRVALIPRKGAAPSATSSADRGYAAYVPFYTSYVSSEQGKRQKKRKSKTKSRGRKGSRRK
jgi:hypothetical protein